MNLYTTRLGELAAHLDIGAIEQDETGHACLTLDKLWAIHLAPLGEESMVIFLRAGTLAGEVQARALLRGNLFSAEHAIIRVALGQDDHLILWCQQRLESTNAEQLHQALGQLVARAVALTGEMDAPSSASIPPSLRV